MSNPNVTIDRHKYIGGSDLPTILGLNAKYGKSIFEFAKEKAGIIPNDFKGNQFTKYGQLMEPVIRDYINSKYGVNYVEDTVIDNKKRYRGNTDGIDRTAQISIIEIKTFGEKLDVDYYTPQCLFYMKTFDVLAVRLIGYQRPSDFYTGIDYDLEHDDFYFNLEFDESRIEEHIIYFDEDAWKTIEKNIKRFQKVVEKLKENPDMSEEEFNDEFYGNDLISLMKQRTKLETITLELKEAEEESKKLSEKIYDIFDERGIISLDLGNVKFTKVEPTSYETVSIDSAKLKEDHEDIYEQYKMVKTINRKGYILTTVRKENEDVITSK